MVVTKRKNTKIDWLSIAVVTYVALLLIIITILVYTQEGYR